MPFHFSCDRRSFLATSAIGLFASPARADKGNLKPVDQTLAYILNDTHIGEKHPPDSAIPTNLKQVVSEIVTAPVRPAAVIINGDLALKDGQPGDYVHFARLIAP